MHLEPPFGPLLDVTDSTSRDSNAKSWKPPLFEPPDSDSSPDILSTGCLLDSPSSTPASSREHAVETEHPFPDETPCTSIPGAADWNHHGAVLRQPRSATGASRLMPAQRGSGEEVDAETSAFQNSLTSSAGNISVSNTRALFL